MSPDCNNWAVIHKDLLDMTLTSDMFAILLVRSPEQHKGHQGHKIFNLGAEMWFAAQT